VESGCQGNEKLPAQKTGGLYKTHWPEGYVEAVPSRAFRDGTGIFVTELRSSPPQSESLQ
jgi:hypothetical protein